MQAMSLRGRVTTPDALGDDAVIGTGIRTEPKSPFLSPRELLRLVALQRRMTVPACSGRIIRAIAADIESEQFDLARWRRVDEDGPIAEWRS